jgi:hypothetical protein
MIEAPFGVIAGAAPEPASSRLTPPRTDAGSIYHYHSDAAVIAGAGGA